MRKSDCEDNGSKKKRTIVFETAGRKSMMCRLRMVEARMEISDRFKVRSRNRRMARQRMFRRKPVGKEMKASMKERKKEKES